MLMKLYAQVLVVGDSAHLLAAERERNGWQDAAWCLTTAEDNNIGFLNAPTNTPLLAPLVASI
jgi:hypothetical protein